MLSGFKRPRQVAVFLSGSGSTLQSLLENQHQFPVRLVVSNKKKSLGLVKAKRFGVPTYLFTKDESYEDLHQILISYQIDCIFLAGFMKILPFDFIKKWETKILNIHPSLLPQFPGLNSAERSYQAKASMGVSIHQVTEGVDEGKVILQKESLVSSRLNSLSLNDSLIYLRRTEQHLLREVTCKWSL